MSVNENYYCSCLTAGDLSAEDKQALGGQKAALLLGAKWPVGGTITLRFLEGAPELQERVRKVAEEWLKLANLEFAWRKQGPTDIRIAFKQGKGSWSYLGNQCKRIADELTVAAAEMRSSTDASTTATTVLDRMTRVIGILKKTFA